MKPIIRQRVAIFSPQGFIDGNNAYFIITDDDIKYLIKNRYKKEPTQENIKIVVVSLKQVIFFNINGINILTNNLKKIKEKSDFPLIIGFSDYNHTQYHTIRRFFGKHLEFSLFYTTKIATLFTTPSLEQERILIWNEDKEQRNLQSIELYERGYQPVIKHSKKGFLKAIKYGESKGEDYIIVQDTIIGNTGAVPFARVSGSAIIYTLKGFLDTRITKQFDYSYHYKAIKTGFKLFVFDMKNIISMNIRGVDFFENLQKEVEKFDGTIAIVNFDIKNGLEQIKMRMQESNIKFYKTLDTLFNNKALLLELGGIIKEQGNNHKTVTRKLITYLPSFINGTVITLEMFLATTAVKTGKIKIKDLTISNESEKLASSIGFYGDLEGMMILVFPLTLAKKSCSMLIGEEVKTVPEVMDTLAEFANTIAGRVKKHLADKNISISITLPRAYASINDLRKSHTIHRGVQVDLNFNEETFSFFLTR